MIKAFRSKSTSLKEQFGPEVTHRLSTGLVCSSPFHVPNANGAMIFGRMNLRAARELCTKSAYRPVSTLDGTALGCLWMTDFGDSTCGPYQELTVTFLVAREQKTVPWVNAWTPFAAQLDPEIFICEHVLLLNNRHAIAYGKELHGFDKHLGELGFRSDGKVFHFRASEDCVPTVQGQLAVRGDTFMQARMLMEVSSAMGLRATGAALFETLHPLRVVTPIVHQQRRTDIFFRGRPMLQPWSRKDTLTVGDSPIGRTIAALEFEPTTVQVLVNGEGVMPYDVPKK